MGGPLARFLIERHKLEPTTTDANLTVGVEHERDEMIPIAYESMLRAIFVVFLAIGIGINIDLGGRDPIKRFEGSFDAKGISAEARKRFYGDNFTDLFGIA